MVIEFGYNDGYLNLNIIKLKIYIEKNQYASCL